MKRSLFAVMVLIALGLGTTFVASAVFSTQSAANDGQAAPSSGKD